MACKVKVQPSIENSVKEKLSDEKNFKNLSWSLKPLTNWMNFLGVAVPSSDLGSNVTGWLSYSYHYFVFILVLLINFWMLVHIFLNAKNVSSAYSNQTSNNTLSWNFIIDTINTAVCSVFAHISVLALTKPGTWEKLLNSLKTLEKYDSTASIYPKCREVAGRLLVYVIFWVVY